MATKKTVSSKKSAAKKQPAKKSVAKKSVSKKEASSSKSDTSIYSDPELRERLKKEITDGDKGGKPGQWSARKAQLLAHEYEKAGGEYKKGAKKGAAQKSISQWTKEDWQTSEGSADAEKDDGTMTRYLPKAAWDKLTPAQKKATNLKKETASKKGEQFVSNTDFAKKARKSATKKSSS